jgi:hypothetical protein
MVLQNAPHRRPGGAHVSTELACGSGRGKAAGAGPSIPRTAAGPPCRAYIADRTAPGPGQQLRGAHDHGGALGHGARRSDSLT